MTSVNVTSVTNTVTVTEGDTTVVTITTAGPQGPKGDTGDPGPAGSGTDLGYTAATRLLTSSSGADVTLPLATTTDAGLQSAADKTRIDELGIDDSPTFAGATFTGTVTAPHIHGSIAGSLYLHVKNTSGAALSKGTPVRVTGAVGDTTTLEVAAADSASIATLPAVAILDADLNNNGQGHAVLAGEIVNLNTAAYTLGQSLYVASGGGLTGTRPTLNAQAVAIVGRVHASTGTIAVTIDAVIPEQTTPKAITIELPRVDDEFTLFYTQQSTTLSQVLGVVRGTGASVTFELRYAADRSAAGTLATVPEAITNTTTGEQVTIQNMPIPADRYVWIKVTAMSGTVSELNVSVEI